MQNMKYLWNSNPADRENQTQADYPNDPVCLMIIGAKEAEDQIENDSANIPCRTGPSRDDTVVPWVNMWDHRKVRAVTSLGKYRCDGGSSNESVDVDVRDGADADQHNSLDDSTFEISGFIKVQYRKASNISFLQHRHEDRAGR